MNIKPLMPCPFCGGEAKRLTLTSEINFGGDVITCTKCQCSSRVEFGGKETLAEAWNNRAAADERDILLAEAREALGICIDQGDLPLEVQWMVERASKGRRLYVDDRALTAQQAAVPDPTGRTPQDYAIEHAEYMATSAEHVSTAFDEYGMALIAAEQEGGDTDALLEAVDEARSSLQEALVDLRGYIYEFRKRRDRAAAPASDSGEGRVMTKPDKGTAS